MRDIEIGRKGRIFSHTIAYFAPKGFKAPFFQMFGNANFRLLRNADDPTKFIQVIEYETPEAFEMNRQSLASDMRMQAFLAAWRAMLPGALEVDVYQEV